MSTEGAEGESETPESGTEGPSGTKGPGGTEGPDGTEGPGGTEGPKKTEGEGTELLSETNEEEAEETDELNKNKENEDEELEKKAANEKLVAQRNRGPRGELEKHNQRLAAIPRDTKSALKEAFTPPKIGEGERDTGAEDLGKMLAWLLFAMGGTVGLPAIALGIGAYNKIHAKRENYLLDKVDPQLKRLGSLIEKREKLQDKIDKLKKTRRAVGENSEEGKKIGAEIKEKEGILAEYDAGIKDYKSHIKGLLERRQELNARKGEDVQDILEGTKKRKDALEDQIKGINETITSIEGKLKDNEEQQAKVGEDKPEHDPVKLAGLKEDHELLKGSLEDSQNLLASVNIELEDVKKEEAKALKDLGSVQKDMEKGEKQEQQLARAQVVGKGVQGVSLGDAKPKDAADVKQNVFGVQQQANKSKEPSPVMLQNTKMPFADLKKYLENNKDKLGISALTTGSGKGFFSGFIEVVKEGMPPIMINQVPNNAGGGVTFGLGLKGVEPKPEDVKGLCQFAVGVIDKDKAQEHAGFELPSANDPKVNEDVKKHLQDAIDNDEKYKGKPEDQKPQIKTPEPTVPEKTPVARKG